MLKCFLTLFCTCIFSFGFAQNSFHIGALPQFNLKAEFKHGFSYNTKFETFHDFYKHTAAENTWKYAFNRMQWLNGARKKLPHNFELEAYYMFRANNNQLSHRFFEGFNHQIHFNKAQIIQRFILDQTLAKNTLTVYRFRYRISFFNYCKENENKKAQLYYGLHNEYLYILQGKQSDFEIRCVPVFGLQFKNKVKCEIGFDYRATTIHGKGRNSNLLFYNGWHLSI